MSIVENNASTRTIAPPPAPDTGTVRTILNIRRMGFLHFMEHQWQQLGDVFSIGIGSMNLVFAIHPDAVRHIAIKNRDNYDKLASYDRVRGSVLGNGLIASNGDIWKRQRKLMAPFYTPRGIADYADIFLSDALRTAELWETYAASGETVAMDEEMASVTAAIILRSMFSMEALDDIKTMKESVELLIGQLSTGRNMISIPSWVPTPKNLAVKEAAAYVNEFISGLITERRQLAPEAYPDDLLSRLMLAEDDETGATMDESLLRDETVTIFFAGHETTARTMTFAWYALAKNPDIAAKLHHELDTVLQGRTPAYDDLHHLPYTLRVIKETLRLYPPAPFYIRDAINNDVIEGCQIEAGTGIMLSPYLTHRHPDFWDDPLRFDPDRFTPEAEKTRHSHAYHPFASGQRVCIGNNFSLLESHILLAVLAQRFAPALPDGFEPDWTMAGTLGTKNGMPMMIRKRN